MTETTLPQPPSDALSALNVGSVGRQVTPSVMQRLPSPFWNSLRITALMQEFASRFQTGVSPPFDIFSLCIALSRGIDYSIAQNEVLPADQVRVLAAQLKKICQKYSNDRGIRAGIMVLMLSAKNACNSGWFSEKDTKELLSLVNKIGDSYCNLEDVNTGPSCLPSTFPTIMERFYPLMKMGQILASLEVKPGYNAYMIDFHISKNIAYSPQEKIRLFVAQVDNLETSACIINPPRVNFILNGKEVDRRNIISMDTGPQMPTNVTSMLKFGPNLLQAVGQFNGHYIIVIAFMSVTSSPDASVLHDYVQPPIADSDADNDISEGPSRISLNCPISYTRIRTPVKGRLCKHFQCFDLCNFLDINSRRPSWRCPHCNQSVCYLDIRIDKDMVKVLKEVGQDVSVIIISAGGSWKAVMEVDDHLEQGHDFLNSTKERSEQEESTCPPNASPSILDLTEDEIEVDIFRTGGVEDRKPSQRVNQNDTAQVEDAFGPGVFVSSGSGACTAGSDTHVFGSTSQSTTANFVRVPPLLTEAISPTINLEGGGQSNTNSTASEMQSQLSFNSNLLLQQLQYAGSNEYGRFPTIPRMVTRTPIAVQALPAQSQALVQHQRLRTSSNSSTPSSSSFPSHVGLSANANGLNTVCSDLERQQHFSRSHLNPHQASTLASSSSQHCSMTQNGDRQDRSFVGSQSVQQVVGLQARSQLPYRSSLGISEFQNPHLQQALNPRIPHLQQTLNPRIPQPMGQSPNVNGPSSYLPRNPVQQGNSQVRTPHISGTGNSQQNRTIAAHRASQMARQHQHPPTVPVQSQSLRSGGASFPLNAEGVRGPSMVGGRTNAVSTSRTDTPMELPSDQNWEPRRMRGSLRGQELNDYYREIMGESQPTPQSSQPARPQSNLTSTPPILPTQEQVLMANSRIVHASQQTHTSNS